MCDYKSAESRENNHLYQNLSRFALACYLDNLFPCKHLEFFAEGRKDGRLGEGALVICFAGCEYLCFSVLTYCMIYLTTATTDGGEGGGDASLNSLTVAVVFTTVREVGGGGRK